MINKMGTVGAFNLILVPTTRRRRLFLSLGILLLPIILGFPGVSLSAQTAKQRKVVTRIAPEYPDVLKRANIGGLVHIRAAVAPNGAVESTQLLGGNPVLGQAAMKAVKQWKYSVADSPEELEIWLQFNPHESSTQNFPAR